MRLLLSLRKQERSVPLRFHQNRKRLLAVESHPKANTDETSLFSVMQSFFFPFIYSLAEESREMYYFCTSVHIQKWSNPHFHRQRQSRCVMSHNSPALHRQREQKHHLLIMPLCICALHKYTRYARINQKHTSFLTIPLHQ